MMIYMLLSKKDISLSHRKKFSAFSDVRLVTSFINFGCQPCGIFEGLSRHQ